jgi:hypothetical protein
MVRTGRVYSIHAPITHTMVYVGSTENPTRFQTHQSQARADPLCCPLYRHAVEHHGDLSQYHEETILTVALPEDDEHAKVLLRSLEATVIRTLRQQNPELRLLNKNAPRCENQGHRERMRRWREAHGQGTVDPQTGRSNSYMAIRSRINRQRRRERVAALATAAAAAAPAAATQPQEGQSEDGEREANTE